MPAPLTKDREGPPPKPKKGAFLTARQVEFCEVYSTTRDAKRAALAAGYSPRNAVVMAGLLLNPETYPLVAARIQHLNSQRHAKYEVDTQELLTLVGAGLRAVLPRHMAQGRSRKGVPGWVLTPEELRDLPDEVACWIEETEAQEVTKEDGTKIQKMWVKFASKLGLANILAKHLLTQEVNLNVALSPLEELTKRVDATGMRVKALVDAPVPVQSKVTDGDEKESKDGADQGQAAEDQPGIETGMGKEKG